MITLKQITVNEKIFNTILETYATRIIVTDDIKSKYCGYDNKNTIYFDGSEYLICLESIVAYIAKYNKTEWESVCDWKQVIVRKNIQQKKSVEKDVTGLYSWNYMNRMLSRFYSNKEIEECLKSHTAEYNDNRAQFHYFWTSTQEDGIVEHKECYKYDINGAHLDALVEIFPKAKEYLTQLNKLKKKNKNYKKIVNYYVGFLTRKGYRETYNWIVQRTTKKLYEAIRSVEGILIYANTDGFVVKDIKNPLEVSKKLGCFKLEYTGTAYTYTDKNYMIIQCGDEIIGNALLQVRDKIDLRIGKVVHYDRIKHIDGKDEYMQEIAHFEAINIEEEIL